MRPSEVDVVEAHGTGTSLGDPIEAQALLATYGQDREGAPLYLGSVKSNIGHTQAAAGVAGIIKMVQAMHEGTLPRTLHAETPSTRVHWAEGAVSLLSENIPWPETGRPRRAAVSSFGISGTNAHLILEQAAEQSEKDSDASFPVPWVLSARTPEALAAQADQLRRALPAGSPADVAIALATTRARFEHRAAVVATDAGEFADALAALAEDKPWPGTVRERAAGGGLAMLFTGQGSQRPDMGRELAGTFPVFAQAWHEVLGHLGDEIRAGLEDDRVHETRFAQPGLFALELALYRLWESWGVVPDVVGGHSVGEITAACVAGVFSVEDACALVAARGRLMQGLTGAGAMIAVRATEDEVRPLLGDRLDIAAVNGPGSLVISGDEADALAVAGVLRERGRKTTRLRTSHAFHSPQMDPMLDEFRRTVAGLTCHPPVGTLLSMVTGGPADAALVTDPEYWVGHARGPVRFADGVAALPGLGVTSVLELGPDAALTPMIRETSDIVAIPSLRRGQPEAHTAVTALAHAHCAGATVDWSALFGPRTRHVDLPTYPFQHDRYWLETPGTPHEPGQGQVRTGHPVLDAAIPHADGRGIVLTGGLSVSRQPWLADHRVFDTVLVPGTAVADLVLEGGRHAGCARLAELTLEAPLVVAGDATVAVQVIVGPAETGGGREVTVHSAPDGQTWTRNATALLDPEPGTAAAFAWPPAATPVDLDGAYESLAGLGLDYGPVFRGVQGIWRAGDEIFAEIELPGDTGVTGFTVHPALFDAALHPLAIVLGTEEDGVRLPFSWRGLTVHAEGATTLRVRLTRTADGVRLDAIGGDGRPALTLDELVLRPVSSARLRAAGADLTRSLLAVAWHEVRPSGPATTPDTVTVEGAREGATEALAVTAQVLERVQEAARDGSRLAVVTRSAVSVAGEAVTDLAGAAVWGLLRTAQVEHPGLFTLVDTDDPDDPDGVGTALTCGEPQVAVRAGRLFAPRAIRAAAGAEQTHPFDGDRTVLVTGAFGGVGAIVARHLVAAHGVRRLVLAGRRGLDSPGARDLVTELTGMSAHVTAAACDCSDREALAALLATIPGEHPLGAVVHIAGVVEDGLLDTLDTGSLRRVFAPKADAAWHLHELTAATELSAFVLFSSAAGTFGSPGQANYGAANGFLDGLAAYRRGLGLPGLSMAWGMWALDTGMLEARGRDRIARSGLAPMDIGEALALFDAALAAGDPVAVPARFDPAALRVADRDGTLPRIARSLLPARPVARESAGLADRLAATPVPQQRELVLTEVLTVVAAVLGHASPEAVDPGRPFQELGFDSLTAVELRNRLSAGTGLHLPASLVFDRPTPAALAEYLWEELSETGEQDDAERRLRAALAAIPFGRFRDAGLVETLFRLAGAGEDEQPGGESDDGPAGVEEMDADALVELVLGKSDEE
nr:SDR family NAD(P)-dependent oxidoreductase [Amycolatopsis pithecellobii]